MKDAICLNEPADLRYGPGEAYLYPAQMPPDVYARHKAFRDAAVREAEAGVDGEELAAETTLVERKLQATPSEDFAGLLAKLRWISEHVTELVTDDAPTLANAYVWDGDDEVQRMIVSAWADAERLAKKNGAA
jgi:hypothetical protein